jgi:hypothetical protein
MAHRIHIHADSVESVAAAAREAGASGHACMPFGDRVVGYIDIPSHTVRSSLRKDPRISLLPNRHSHGNDVSAHGDTLKVKAKTARDIFSAVFDATDWDEFDPDL